jgi:hypothetical protein
VHGFTVLAGPGLAGGMIQEVLAELLLFEGDGWDAIVRAEFGAEGFHFPGIGFMRRFHEIRNDRI